MAKHSKINEWLQRRAVFDKSQAMTALEKAVEAGRIDYITSTFISYLISEGRPLTVEQARSIGLSIENVRATQQEAPSEADGRREPRSS